MTRRGGADDASDWVEVYRARLDEIERRGVPSPAETRWMLDEMRALMSLVLSQRAHLTEYRQMSSEAVDREARR